MFIYSFISFFQFLVTFLISNFIIVYFSTPHCYIYVFNKHKLLTAPSYSIKHTQQILTTEYSLTQPWRENHQQGYASSSLFSLLLVSHSLLLRSFFCMSITIFILLTSYNSVLTYTVCNFQFPTRLKYCHYGLLSCSSLMYCIDEFICLNMQKKLWCRLRQRLARTWLIHTGVHASPLAAAMITARTKNTC